MGEFRSPQFGEVFTPKMGGARGEGKWKRGVKKWKEEVRRINKQHRPSYARHTRFHSKLQDYEMCNLVIL